MTKVAIATLVGIRNLYVHCGSSWTSTSSSITIAGIGTCSCSSDIFEYSYVDEKAEPLMDKISKEESINFFTLKDYTIQEKK